APSSILSLLPRPTSWLSAPASSVLWGSWNAEARGLDHPHEQNLFLGLLPTLALLGAVVVALCRRRDRLRHVLGAGLLTFAALFLLTLMAPMGSVYEWLFSIPGIAAIRSVSRIVLMLLLPVGLAVGFCLSGLENWLQPRVGKAIAALLAAALLPF